MLSSMRKQAGSWMIKILLGVIVVVFVFWGVGSYREQRGNRVAVVNGAVISLDEYRSAYDQLLERYRRQFGDNLDQKLLKTLGLRRQAVDQLINQRLLLQEAGRLGLHVTKEDLTTAIRNVPAFQNNGQFDPRIYKRLLARNRMTPEGFEENIKAELLVEKMQAILLGSVKVSDAEALDAFKWREDEVNLEYVAFKPSSYKDVKVTPEELEAFFSKHDKDYEIPPKINVGYLLFGFKILESQVNVSEEDISDYYDLNKKDYATPKRVRARHILFKIEQDAEEEQIDEARNTAHKVLEEAKAGGDFAKLAGKYSDDPGSKGKGGDLGFFAKDRMVKPFSDAAFSMKPGDISEPVRTPFGWHLIKVEEVQEAKEPGLDEVKDKIRTRLVKDGARTLAYDQADEMYDACYGPGHIADAAKADEVEIHETGFFVLSDRVKGIKQGKKFAEAAFDLGDNEVSEPIEMVDGYYILEVIGRKVAEIPELEVVKEKVRKDLISARQEELAEKAAEEFLNAVKEGAPFQEEVKSCGLKAESTGFFKRFGSIPGIGSEHDMTDAAFALSPSDPLADAVIKGKQGYYVICLKDRKEADPKGFEAKKTEIMRSIVFQKRQKLMEEWLAHSHQQSEIVVEEGFRD